MTEPGPSNSLCDVTEVTVGHCTRRERGWLTGVSVILAPRGGAVAGVDVRGGGPGTRETDLLDPRNLVDRVDAIVLAGGSVFGLAAADGVVRGLSGDGRGWPVGGPGQVVPIVPAAILFDLGRGGVFDHTPGPADGAHAYAAAASAASPWVGQGSVGAGTGAQAGGLKGGVGSASVVLASGATVGALVVLNAVGSPVDPRTGLPYGIAAGLPGEFDSVGPPAGPGLAAIRAALAAASVAPPRPGQATTLAVIATDATLSKAQCQKMAGVGHDGLARSISPVHTMLDGDTVFTMATGARPVPDLAELVAIMEAGAHCLARAVAHAVLTATTVDASADGGAYLRSWRDLAAGDSRPALRRTR